MGCFLLLEGITSCQEECSCTIFLCSRNDLVVTRRCSKQREALVVHGILWQDGKLLCYFDVEMCYLPSTSGQNGVSFGQTQKFSWCCQTQLLAKGSQQVFLTEKSDRLAQPAGCQQESKGENCSFICKRKSSCCRGDGLGLHPSKFCTEVTAFAADGKM